MNILKKKIDSKNKRKIDLYYMTNARHVSVSFS